MRVSGGHQMVASKVRRGLLCMGILAVVQLEWATALEFFSSKCGQTIDITTDHSEQLDSQLSATYEPNQDCTVTIETSFFEKVLVTFQRVDIEGYSPSCTADYLEIYDGPSNFLLKLATICGSSTPSAVVSTGNSITLRFTTDSLVGYSGFYIIVTSFSTGYCGSDDFECDNGRCIDDSLKNDFDDNCGDSSDENYVDLVNNVIGWGIGLIVAVIVGCVVAAILVCVCCGCLCYHLCCKSQPPPRTTTIVVPQDSQQQPGAYPSQQPGAYPSQQPGAYPSQQPGAYSQQPGAYSQQPGAPPPAYNQPPMAMQQIPGQYGQQQAPCTVKT